MSTESSEARAEAGELDRLRAENERLRSQMAALQDRLADVEVWAHRAVAEAQEKTYWLDRWHLDLNALMRQPAAGWIRGAARGLRSVYRAANWLRRRLRP